MTPLFTEGVIQIEFALPDGEGNAKKVPLGIKLEAFTQEEFIKAFEMIREKRDSLTVDRRSTLSSEEAD